MPAQHTVIVGGSSGIGLATAQRLVAKGFTVTITGRDEARLDAAARKLGPEARALRMDGTDTDALPARFSQIGAFDHLVIALGSGKGVGPFAELAIGDVKAGFEEKVYAHFAVAQSALPFLSPTGSVTFISAISAQAAVPGTSGISAANAAIAALVPVLAVELRPRRVNGVAPGVIDTPWWDAIPTEQKLALFNDFTAKTPVGRVGTSDDVADALAFLIGNDFITGHVLPIDGGLRFLAA